jgi:hypothetical protein
MVSKWHFYVLGFSERTHCFDIHKHGQVIAVTAMVGKANVGTVGSLSTELLICFQYQRGREDVSMAIYYLHIIGTVDHIFTHQELIEYRPFTLKLVCAFHGFILRL